MSLGRGLCSQAEGDKQQHRHTPPHTHTSPYHTHTRIHTSYLTTHIRTHIPYTDTHTHTHTSHTMHIHTRHTHTYTHTSPHRTYTPYTHPTPTHYTLHHTYTHAIYRHTHTSHPHTHHTHAIYRYTHASHITCVHTPHTTHTYHTHTTPHPPYHDIHTPFITTHNIHTTHVNTPHHLHIPHTSHHTIPPTHPTNLTLHTHTQCSWKDRTFSCWPHADLLSQLTSPIPHRIHCSRSELGAAGKQHSRRLFIQKTSSEVGLILARLALFPERPTQIKEHARSSRGTSFSCHFCSYLLCLLGVLSGSTVPDAKPLRPDVLQVSGMFRFPEGGIVLVSCLM